MTLSTALIDSVTAEIRKASEWLFEHESGEAYNGVGSEEYQKWYEGNLDSNFTSVNFRLDWLMAEDSGATVDLMVQQWVNDFLDVLENGDSGGPTNDALLKAFDGTRRRGVEPVSVKFIAASYFKEYKKKPEEEFGHYEYTLYFRPLIEWPK